MRYKSGKDKDNTHASAEALRILMVEDLPDVAEGMEMMLQLWGYDVRVATDGAAALKLAPEYHPDVVLLDIGLPGMSGYDLARCLRQLPEFSRTTLIALTGYSQEADRDRAFEAGFDHYLVKGGSLDLLKDILRSRLSPAVGAGIGSA